MSRRETHDHRQPAAGLVQPLPAAAAGRLDRTGRGRVRPQQAVDGLLHRDEHDDRAEDGVGHGHG